MPSTIGKGVVIEGEVRGGEDLVIDGKVDAAIELPQHVLTVGPTGRVSAQLSAKSVVVLGKVNGSIQASELVRIGDAGSLEGAISAPRLAMGRWLAASTTFAAGPPRHRGLRWSCVNELHPVALTQRFLALREHHGSQHLVVKLVAVGRGTSVPGAA